MAADNAARVFVTEHAVKTELDRMGLEAEPLRRGLSLGLADTAGCTENDPRTFAGFTMWGRSNRGLSEELRGGKNGWRKREHLGIPFVISPDGKFLISVLRGNSAVGLDRYPPNVWRKRGPAWREVVREPHQPTLFPEPHVPTSDAEVWMLLHFKDVEELRAEISQPLEIGSDGFVARWGPRIILQPIPLVAPRTTADEDNPPETDVDFDVDPI